MDAEEDQGSPHPYPAVGHLPKDQEAHQGGPDELQEIEGKNRRGVSHLEGLGQADLSRGSQETHQKQPE